ncbi:MAG: hypothetical protein R3C53_00425 [Pirellulaceae bacterium]
MTRQIFKRITLVGLGLGSAVLPFSQAEVAIAQSPVALAPTQTIEFEPIESTSRRNPQGPLELRQTQPLASGARLELQAQPLRTAQQAAVRKPPATVPPTIPPVVLAPDANARELAAAAASQTGETDEPATGEETKQGDQEEEKPDSEDSAPSKSEKSLAPLQNREISREIKAVNISVDGIGTGLVPSADPRPVNAVRPLPTGIERTPSVTCVNWQPSLICHNPLYFEDAILERHGHARFGCLQSLASGVKFYSTLPLMPYLRTLKPKHECQYALGHWRPGSCAPLVKDTLPYDKQAAVVEALSLASFFWAVPL